MHFIIYKDSRTYPQLIIGPFASYGAAYDALCEMPAPDEGHKYIEEAIAFENIPQRLRDLARQEDAEAEHAHMMPKELAQKLQPGQKVRALVAGSGEVDGEELKFEASELLTIDRLSHLGGSQGLAITAYSENGVVNVFDEADYGGRYPFEAL